MTPWPPAHLLTRGLSGPSSAALAQHGFTVLRTGHAPMVVLASEARELWVDGVKAVAFGRSRVLWSLLASIAASPGGTRQALFEAVWDESYRPPSSDDKLHMAIVRLRKRLRDTPLDLEPEPGGGYTLTGVGAVLRYEAAAVVTPSAARVSGPDVAVRGREADLGALRDALTHGPVCITGPPGVGKSLLARVVASQAPQAWRVELANCTHRDDVLQALGRALDVPLGAAPEAQLGAALAHRGPSLIWLDHLDRVGEPVAELVAGWHGVAPETRWLATAGRAPTDGPTPWHAHALSPLDRDAGAAVYRDQLQQRGITSSPTAVEALVDALGGLPLAIRLAAARAPVLTAEGVLAQLEASGLRVIARPGASTRHASMRRAVTWSLEQLDDEHRSALAQCAVFEGGFTVESASAVVQVGEAWIVDVLDALCSWNLVIPDAVSPGRLWVPGPVAAVAQEALTDDARAAVQRRHAEWFARLGTPESLSSVEPTLAAARLADLANLDVATAADDPESAARAGLAVMQVALRVGPLARGIRVGRGLLRRNTLAPETAARVAIALHLAHRQSGEPASAHAALDEAERRLTGDGDDAIRASLLVYRAELLRVQGLSGEAAPLLAAAADLVPTGDPTGVGRLRLLVWALSQRYTDPAAACIALSQLATTYRRLGDRRQEATVQLSLGAIHLEQGRLPAARQALQHGLTCAADAQDLRREGLIRSALGATEGTDGHFELARTHLEAALAIHQRLGARRSEGIVAGNLAELLVRSGREAEAIAQLDIAVDRATEVGDRATQGHFLATRGEARVRLGDTAGGWRDLDDALAVTDAGDSVRERVEAARERAAAATSG